MVGYVYGSVSERRLCREMHLNLAYRSFWSTAGHLSVDGTTVSPDDLLNSLATDHRAAKCYELF